MNSVIDEIMRATPNLGDEIKTKDWFYVSLDLDNVVRVKIIAVKNGVRDTIFLVVDK